MPDITMTSPCVVSLDEPDTDGFDTYVFPEPGIYSNVPMNVVDHWYTQAHMQDAPGAMDASLEVATMEASGMGATGRQVKVMLSNEDLEAMDAETRKLHDEREAAARERAQQALAQRDQSATETKAPKPPARNQHHSAQPAREA
jgi:hypothetical protein